MPTTKSLGIQRRPQYRGFLTSPLRSRIAIGCPSSVSLSNGRRGQTLPAVFKLSESRGIASATARAFLGFRLWLMKFRSNKCSRTHTQGALSAFIGVVLKEKLSTSRPRTPKADMCMCADECAQRPLSVRPRAFV